MNRATFGTWGVELDADEFAAALAALGVVGELRGARAYRALLEAWREPVMRWLPPATPPEREDAAFLSRLWRAIAERFREGVQPGEPPRMAIEWDEGDDPSWVVGQLGAAAFGRLSVFLARPRSDGRIRWNWPVEIGLLEDEGSRPLRQPGAFTHFARVRSLDAADARFDLILLAEPLHTVAGRVLATGARASCILELRPQAGPWEVAAPLLAALQAHTGAAAAGFAPVAQGRLGAWLDQLLGTLAHNHPLDVALRTAASAVRAPGPLLFADERLLAETRLQRVAERLAAVARADDPLRSEAMPGRLSFDRETDGASEVARRSRLQRLVVPRPRPRRTIQARVASAGRVIAVRIAEPGGEWASAHGEDFPSPAGDGPHRLTVVLIAPELLDEPLVDTIVLPADGPSTTCEFHVPPSPDARVRARIAVLHRNRLLQTVRLDAPAEGMPTLHVEPEATICLRLDDLDWRRPFDAALLVNHDDAGVPGVTAVAGAHARLLMHTDFGRAVETLYEILEEAVLEPAGFGALDDPSAVALFITLANHGHALHDAFMRAEGVQAIVDAGLIQLAAVRPGADFPLEFVYDRVAPDTDATLCPHAARGLREGRCGSGCAARSDPRTVCPVGFWGFTKSIERRPYAGQIANHELEARAEPRASASSLPAPTGALLAASEHVLEPDLEALHGALKLAMGGRARHVSSWSEWRAGIASDRPPLLVLLPHTLTHPMLRLPAMEIGGDEPLAQTGIRADVVRPEDGARPLVILLGCRTAAEDLSLYAFPPKLHAEGAAIVLGTVTKVLGRHAAPVAGRIVAELSARASAGEAYITDVIRDLRCALVAEGLPLAMALVAYGDGEWRLGGA
jgi:hypothetical protein